MLTRKILYRFLVSFGNIFFFSFLFFFLLFLEIPFQVMYMRPSACIPKSLPFAVSSAACAQYTY